MDALPNRLVAPLAMLIVVTIGALMLYDVITHHAELVAPIGTTLQVAMIGAGAFAGLCFAVPIYSANTGASGYFRQQTGGWLFLLMPVLGGFAGSHMARRAVELTAFANVVPVRDTVDAVVTGRGTHKSSPYLAVRAAADGRIIEIPASWPAYEAAVPGYDAIELPRETGRGGVQRVLVPFTRVSAAVLIRQGGATMHRL